MSGPLMGDGGNRERRKGKAMVILSLEAQKRAKEAFLQLDKAVAADRLAQATVREQARAFFDSMYAVFEHIERESLTLKEVFVSMQRIDDHQFEVKNRHYPPFILLLDKELAYDSKPISDPEQKTRWVVELSARVFIIFSPPLQGVIRVYTIFGDGSWKRAMFMATSDGIQSQSNLLPDTKPDTLLFEAIDVLSLVCTRHPTWANIASIADTIKIEQLADRSITKTFLTGLGKPRT